MAMSDDLDDMDEMAEPTASADMATSVLVITFITLSIAIYLIGSVGAERYGLEYMGIAAIAPRVGGESGKVLAIVSPDGGAVEAGSRTAEMEAALPDYLKGSSYVMVSLGSEQGIRVGDRLKIGASYPDNSTVDYVADVVIVGDTFCHAVSTTEIKKLEPLEGDTTSGYKGWSVKRDATGAIEESVVKRIFPPK